MSKSDSEHAAGGMILGRVASPGLARGFALLCNCSRQKIVPRRQIGESEVMNEMARYDAAVSAVEAELLLLQEKVRGELGKTAADLFEAQILLLKDATLRDAVRDLCLARKSNLEAAIEDAVKQLVASFSQLSDPYFRERGADLLDIGKRLLDHVSENTPAAVPALLDECVVVTSELLASVVAQWQGRGVRGLVVEHGGLTAHASILVRSLGLPMLVQVPEATKRIRAGDRLIIDGLAGRVFINPKAEITRKYDQLEADLVAHKSALQDLVHLPNVTADGVSIKLCANIGQAADAVAATNVNADGAGLYRTEFVFLVQDQFPSEEEQYQLYRTTAEQFQPRETVIRVLDIGSDKPLSYFPLPKEPNPALGSRGTRLLLNHPAVLQSQLRAILRLSASHPVSILLPMVAGMEELRAVKTSIERAKASLVRDRKAFNSEISVGVMVETPSAAILVRHLAGEADFLSVGTNDLIQYLLVADRNGSADWYEPLHPAVLRALADLVNGAKAAGKPLSICGEMASDPVNTALLIGFGFRSFSVSPGKLLEVKQAITKISLPQAESLAKKALTLNSVEEIKALVRGDWDTRSPVTMPTTSAPAPAKEPRNVGWFVNITAT